MTSSGKENSIMGPGFTLPGEDLKTMSWSHDIHSSTDIQVRTTAYVKINRKMYDKAQTSTILDKDCYFNQVSASAVDLLNIATMVKLTPLRAGGGTGRGRGRGRPPTRSIRNGPEENQSRLSFVSGTKFKQTLEESKISADSGETHPQVETEMEDVTKPPLMKGIVNIKKSDQVEPTRNYVTMVQYRRRVTNNINVIEAMKALTACLL